MTLLISIFILTSWNLVGDSLASLNPKIVGGLPAKNGQFPFMVSINFGNPSDTHFCGGALISDQWILTAAHCINSFTPSDGLAVYLGGILLNDYEQGELITVEDIIIHPEYNTSPTVYVINDISLLKLSKPVQFSENIKPVKLPKKNQETAPGNVATMMGWGYQENGEESNILLYTQLQIISDDECYELNEQETGPMNICAGIPGGGKGQCSGDSGGPLIVDSELVGVVSWSIKPCGNEEHPGISTQVSNYIDWITQYVNI